MLFLIDRVYMLRSQSVKKGRHLTAGPIVDFWMQDVRRMEPDLQDAPDDRMIGDDPVSCSVETCRDVTDRDRIIASMTDREALKVATDLVMPHIYV